jgi:hypothetical protein
MRFPLHSRLLAPQVWSEAAEILDNTNSCEADYAPSSRQQGSKPNANMKI